MRSFLKRNHKKHFKQKKKMVKVLYMKNAMMKKSILTLSSLVLLSGCSVSEVRSQLGVSKSSPDEFAVVKRAPLEIPNKSAPLPQPKRGAARPQEASTDIQAKKTIYGDIKEPALPASSADNSFLSQAGASESNSNIRAEVDAESATLHDRNKPVAEKIFGIGGDADSASASVVNAQEEARRIQNNLQEGKPVTEGTTPSVEE